MQGSVRKRGKTWSYRFRDDSGKQIEKGGFEKKGEASAALREVIREYQINGFLPQKITFGEFTNKWLEDYVKKLRKQTTYNRYKEIAKKYLYPTLEGMEIAEINMFHIEKILQENRGRAGNTTLQAIYTLANTIFNRAVKTRTILQNPCIYVERPRRDKFSAETLTAEEINTVLKSLDMTNIYDYMYFIGFSITLETGLRRGELTGIEWKNIDFKKSTLTVKNNLVYTNGKVLLEKPKTQESERVLYVSDYIIGLLKNLLKQQKENKLKYGEYYTKNIFEVEGKPIEVDFVMRWEDGHYIHPLYFTNKTTKVLKKCAIDKRIRFHDLRHTNATLLLEQGVDFKTLQKRLGHKDIGTTMNIYADVTENLQKNATQKIRQVLDN